MVEAQAEIPHEAGFDPAVRRTTRGAKKDNLTRSVSHKPQRDFSSVDSHRAMLVDWGQGCYWLEAETRDVIQA